MKDFTIPYSSTCYQYLKCPRGMYFPSWCLDWREICDGKIDCWDGEDERNCWLLELNMCRPGEYRFRNGQCIPEGFLLDNRLNPDCLDGSDELTLISVNTDGYPERCSTGDHVAIGIFNVVLTRVVNYPVHVERYIAIHSYIAFSHAKPISM
jgi:hypothetical protein